MLCTTCSSAEELERALSREDIEVAPLAYMRGRTLNNAFVILDEAQNTTTEQMFMLLTRIGTNSKCVVTGDVTQIDLAGEQTLRPGRGASGPQKRARHRLELFYRTGCRAARAGPCHY